MYHRMAWSSLFNSKFAQMIRLSAWLFPKMKGEGIASDRIAEHYKNIRFNEDDEVLGRLDITATMRSVVDKDTKKCYPDQEIWDEALLLIRTGGDTTSAALSSFFFYLSRNSACYETLASEIRNTFKSIDDIK